jgi:hypothetical protein
MREKRRPGCQNTSFTPAPIGWEFVFGSQLKSHVDTLALSRFGRTRENALDQLNIKYLYSQSSGNDWNPR